MPRDDLTIDGWVDGRVRMPPIDHQDAAAILDEFTNRVANLPNEIEHMQEEIRHKDKEMEQCLSIIRKHDESIQKWIRLNGSNTPNPKEKDLSRIILENYDKSQILQEEKLALAQKCSKRMDYHVRFLDAQIQGLRERGEMQPDPELPSLLRAPPHHTNALRAEAVTSSAVLPMPLAPITNSASVVPARHPNQYPPRTRPSLIDGQIPGAVSSASPATPAAALIGRQARESSLGAANSNKRQRLTGGVHPPSGLARQSSLGPGTPKAGTPTGGARAGSAGPRVMQKTGPKKPAPTGSRQSGLPRKNVKGIIKGATGRIKGPKGRDSASVTNESDSDDDSEEADEAVTPRNKDGEGDDDMVDVDDEEASDDKKYCTCQSVSYGDMVACDNEDCPYEWFHWSCVGLKSEPEGSWICPVCTAEKDKKQKK